MWKRDTRPENIRRIGEFSIFSEVDKDEGTAHVVRFGDGSELRVLPDERSGRKRSNLVRQAVSHLASVVEANTSISPQTYLYGLLLESGFTKWEWEVGEPTIEEWLADWFRRTFEDDMPRDAAELLVDELEADGWEIRKEGAV